MKKYGIPTAKYEIFSNSAAAIEYLKMKINILLLLKQMDWP